MNAKKTIVESQASLDHLKQAVSDSETTYKRYVALLENAANADIQKVGAATDVELRRRIPVLMSKFELKSDVASLGPVDKPEGGGFPRRGDM